MKVILCEDVDNLGEMGETVNVAPGYARNFLVPRRLAVSLGSASANQVEHEMRIIKKREERRRTELSEVAKGIDGVRIEFVVKAGSEGKLFGSITTLHIAQKLGELGHDVDRRKIVLSEPVKTTGDHDVVIRLKSGIEATIKVVVIGDEPETAPAEEEEVAASTEDTAEEVADEEAMPEIIVNTPSEEAEPVLSSDDEATA